MDATDDELEAYRRVALQKAAEQAAAVTAQILAEQAEANRKLAEQVAREARRGS